MRIRDGPGSVDVFGGFVETLAVLAIAASGGRRGQIGSVGMVSREMASHWSAPATTISGACVAMTAESASLSG